MLALFFVVNMAVSQDKHTTPQIEVSSGEHSVFTTLENYKY